ncbi:hypothetical protein HDU76_010134, partial [Blyttiomyces sp. JEL0837]
MQLRHFRSFQDRVSEPVLVLSTPAATNLQEPYPHGLRLECYNNGFTKLYREPLADYEADIVPSDNRANFDMTAIGRVVSTLASNSTNFDPSTAFRTPECIEDIFSDVEAEKLIEWIHRSEVDDCPEKTFLTKFRAGEIVPVKWTIRVLGLGESTVKDGEKGRIYVELVGKVDLTTHWLATILPCGLVSEAMRNKNWAQTPLGSMETWPHCILSAISLIMNITSAPMVVVWGKDRCLIPNDAYAEVFAINPDSVGGPVRIVRKEAYERGVKVVIDRTLRGETIRVPRFSQLCKRQDGSFEERLYSTTSTPLRNEYGYVEGMQSIMIETTAKILAEERQGTDWLSLKLNEFSDQLFSEFPSIIKEAANDIAYAAIYMLDKPKLSLTKASIANVDESHIALPKNVDVSADVKPTDGFPILECYRTQTVMELHDLKHLPPLPSGHKANAFARDAVLVPFKLVSDDQNSRYEGVLVVGVCAHRNFDDDYKEFVSLLAAKLVESLHVIDSFEIERRRVSDLAALDEQKTRFFTSISHEIRAPLSLVLGPIEDCLAQLEDKDLPQLPSQENSTKSSKTSIRSTQFKRKMGMARDNALRIKALVDRLLDFHKLEAGKMKPRYVRVNLTTLTKNTIEVFRSAIEAKGIICDTSEIHDLRDMCVVDVD